MDSLTQIVLGAAVAEVCLGKKLGNKAMVWGAIAGTIPDLDILGNLVLNKLDGLAFHRGISHSIFFAVTFSFIIAYLAKWFYDKGYYRNKILRNLGAIFSTLFVGLLASITGLIGYVAGGNMGLSILGLPAIFIGMYFIYRTWKTKGINLDIDPKISYIQWYNFFFWAIITHPILDCFTVYGTQLFQPFSDYRVSWDNISVADPVFTMVFGMCLLGASFYHRSDKKRRYWNYLGIGLSSLYMMWTFSNKAKVDTILEQSLEKQEIPFSRYMTSPTILNNILWNGTVESDTSFWLGQYSLWDKEPIFKLKEVNKNYNLLKYDLEEDKTLKVLKWFSKDYCAVIARNDGKLQINDLRYGQFDMNGGNNSNNYIFRFVLEDSSSGYHLSEADGGPPPGSEKEMFPKLWKRIMGE